MPTYIGGQDPFAGSVSDYIESKEQDSREEIIFIDLFLDENNKDPNYGPTDFYTDPNSFDTPKTTDSVFAYNPNQDPKVYRLSTRDLGAGSGIHFPILDKSSVKITPGQIKKGKIATSSKLNIRLFDTFTRDTFELQGDYADRRKSGSFLGKLIARNYIANRIVNLYTGYAIPGQKLDVKALKITKFLVKEIKRNKDGTATLSLVDPTYQLQKSKGKVPQESNGTLVSSISSSDTTITIRSPERYVKFGSEYNEFSNIGGMIGGGISESYGSSYPSAYTHIKIDDEIIKIREPGSGGTTSTNDTITFTNVQRGQYGTASASHDAEEKVEKCFCLDDFPSISYILIAILDGHLDVTCSSRFPNFLFGDSYPRYIGNGKNEAALLAPFWKERGLSDRFNDRGINLTGIITKPMDGKKLIEQLLEIYNASLYWNTDLNIMKLRNSSSDVQPVRSFDFRENIENKSISVKELSSKQKTRQTVVFGKKDYSKSDDIDNFSESYTIIDGVVEENYRVRNAGKDIKTSYINDTLDGIQDAIIVADEIVIDDSNTHYELTFRSDVENFGYLSVDNLFGPVTGFEGCFIGDTIEVVTDKFLNADGTPIVMKCYITSLKDVKPGVVEVKCETEYRDEDGNADFVVDDDYQSPDFSAAQSLNLGDLFSANRIPGRRNIIRINSQIAGGRASDGGSKFALESGSEAQWPDGIEIQVRGRVIGGGSYGGNGGLGQNSGATPGRDGGNGGHAIYVGCDTVIDNKRGLIFGGGGGAGGAGAYYKSKKKWYYFRRKKWAQGGSGGGAGAGASANGVNPGGAKGGKSTLRTYGGVEPVDGKDGNIDNPGGGDYSRVNVSKAGGDFGENGPSGQNNTARGGAGGKGGYAVVVGLGGKLTKGPGFNKTQVRGKTGRQALI